MLDLWLWSSLALANRLLASSLVRLLGTRFALNMRRKMRLWVVRARHHSSWSRRMIRIGITVWPMFGDSPLGLPSLHYHGRACHLL